MRKILRTARALAMEEEANGKVVHEKEHVIYAKLSNVDLLQAASGKVRQEQWGIYIDKTDDNAGQGSVRVRLVQEEGKPDQYVLTTKVKKDDSTKLEVTVPTTQDNFLQFKFLSNDGLRKDRYHFPIQGTDLVWEIDMFLKEDGTYHEWCKIDLEVDDLEAPIPELPIEFDEVILPKGYGRKDEATAETLIETLYDQCFKTKNTFINKY